MTVLKAQFIKGRPFSSDLAPKSGTVIARLLQIDSPNDEVRLIKSVKAPIGPDGSVEIELSPTLDNQAYEITLAPRSNLTRPRLVKIPDQESVEWEALTDVNPNTFAPYASGGSGGSGLKQYASKAELDAVTTAEVGVLTVDDTLAAFPELAGYVGNGPSQMVVNTSVVDYPADEEDSAGVGGFRLLVQTTVISHPTAGNAALTLHRKAYYDANTDDLVMPYELWTSSINTRPNTEEGKAIAFFLPASFGGGVSRIGIPSTGTYTLKTIDGEPTLVEDVAP